MKNGNVLVGLAVGAFVGWVVGNILADYIAPEYYTDEELQELEEIAANYKPKESERVGTKETMGKKRDYSKIIPGQDKEALISLAEKHNNPEWEDDDNDNVDEDFEVQVMDYEEYLETLEVDQIYVMTKFDFTNNDENWEKTTMLYYPEDDVLTSEDNVPYKKPEKVVGDVALLNFGMFSEDPEIVYVCNPELKGLYEIRLQSGSYEDVVAKAPRKKKNVFEEAHKEKEKEGDE